MTNKKLRFELKHIYGDYEVFVSFDGDKDISEIVEIFKSFLVSVGFHPDTVATVFGDDNV